MEKFVIKKDGKKCEVFIKETSNGIKAMTKGSDCKKLLGKSYFRNQEVQIRD